jgi:hypothetical protein
VACPLHSQDVAGRGQTSAVAKAKAGVEAESGNGGLRHDEILSLEGRGICRAEGAGLITAAHIRE